MTAPNPIADDTAPAPYSGLTPDLILDAVDSTGRRSDGRLLALNSYENRVYQVGLDEASPVVVKFYRPGRWSDEQILEEHAFALELAEDEVPLVPPCVHSGQTLFRFQGHRFAVFEKRGGRAPELDDPEVLEWMGRFLARLHNVGGRTAFRSRPALDLATFGEEPRQWLVAHDFVPADLKPAWLAAADQALEAIAAAFGRAGPVQHIRLHGDCHAGNVLWRPDEGPHFVDLDDARTGPALQDLWMLLSGDRASMTRQLSDVLAGYEEFREFDRRELHLLEALRTLRLLHYSAWLARRWTDPAFPMAFPWFNTQRYWQDRILELREQIAALQEPPLGPL